MGKIRHSGFVALFCVVTQILAPFTWADTTTTTTAPLNSGFGPLTSYTPPTGLSQIPGVNSPCLSGIGGALGQGIQQIGDILNNSNSTKALRLYRVGEWRKLLQYSDSFL